MKKLALLLALAAAWAIGLPATAEAGHTHCRAVSHCDACHHPVYAVWQFVGYDRCGEPVFQWVVQPHHGCHQPPSCDYPPAHHDPRHGGYDHGYDRGYRPPRPDFGRIFDGFHGSIHFRGSSRRRCN